LAEAVTNPNLSRTLSDYADQLHRIQASVATLAKSTEHKDIVSYVVSSVSSASSVARSASRIISSMELYDQNVARTKRTAKLPRTGIK